MKEQHSLHVVPLKTYLWAGAALLVLTAVTVTVSFINLGALNIVIPLGIAFSKTLLVILFFMHLWYDNKIHLLIFATSLFFLTVLVTLTLIDTMRRGDLYAYRRSAIENRAVIYGVPEGRELPPELLAGKGVFDASCGNCHVIDTSWGLGRSFSGLDDKFIREFISRVEFTRYEMEPFAGLEDERVLLAEYISSQTDKSLVLKTGKEVFDRRCGFCHTVDGEVQPLYDSFYGSGVEDVFELIPLLPTQIEMMVPWSGTEEEQRLVAEYIMSWYTAEPE